MSTPQVTVIDGCTVVTMDPGRHEYAVGHVVIDGSRIREVAPGRYLPAGEAVQLIDGSGCVLTPGLVNTHHHLYQWATRGYAVDATLFEWLTTLYPVWGSIDEGVVGRAAAAAIGQLARSGCTTVMDHHYVFPRGGGDPLGAEIRAAEQLGVRFFATRGSMDLGESQGGLPPDHVVESIDEILDATAAAVDIHHDPSAESMVRVGVAPCSPFSVTTDLLRAAADLARDRGVRLHTHLAETLDEEDYCREHFSSTPIDYMESVGWLGDDVWFAHGIHFSDKAIRRLAETGTGVAHCPSSNARLGAGVCRTHDLLAAGAPVGLGVDGAASNEATSLLEEARHALLFARALGGPTAMGVRQALETATLGGARLLGWDDQIGSIEPGKQADLCLWRLDTLAHAGIADPVAGLVLGTPPPLDLVLVAGRPVIQENHLVRAEERELAAGAVAAAQRVGLPVPAG